MHAHTTVHWAHYLLTIPSGLFSSLRSMDAQVTEMWHWGGKEGHQTWWWMPQHYTQKEEPGEEVSISP